MPSVPFQKETLYISARDATPPSAVEFGYGQGRFPFPVWLWVARLFFAVFHLRVDRWECMDT
jgi:hypothetical protein